VEDGSDVYQVVEKWHMVVCRGKLRVLVPGAGLGRLAFEICKRGFSCQGNEFSFYMLLSSNFILNRVEKTEQFTIYPFVHSFSNIRDSEQQLAPICIPDVLPSSIPLTADFSMVAGDFIEVYGDGTKNQGQWDVVATCFFIDTAKNIIQYLEIIHKILKPGGTWINLGPLLYHFENTPGENSIELSLDDVRKK
jgi:carnosine N-methyltransferase